MGLGGILKRAFSAVGEFDKKAVYGSDYKERGQALRELTDVNMRAKLLENEDKFQRIQQMRQELDQKALEDAANFSSSVDPQDSGIMGPPNPNNPNDLAGKMVEPTLPGSIRDRLRDDDMGALGPLVAEKRRMRHKKEEQTDAALESKLAAEEALAGQRESSAGWNDRRPVTPGGGRNPRVRSTTQGYQMVNGRPVFGTNITMDDGEVRFEPYQGGAQPLYGNEPATGDKNALVGASGSYADLDNVISNFEKADAEGLLGPLRGRFKEFDAKYLGGITMTEDQRVLMQSIDRAKTLAAFAEGGKQLTGVEKAYFDENYPRLSNTNDPQTFIRLAREIQAAIKRGAGKRMDLMSPARRPSAEAVDRMFPSSAPKARKWVEGPDGVMELQQ